MAAAAGIDDKRRIARDVGKYLCTSFGNRAHYAPAIVKAAMRKLRFPAEWDGWALSLFCSMQEFDAYHDARGERADFSVMRSSMPNAINATPGATADGNGGWQDLLNVIDLLD